MKEEKHLYKVFCYGTLLYPETRIAVMGHDAVIKHETLKDYNKYGLNIVKEKGGVVYGAWFEASEEDMKCLDRYEGVSSHLYRRINVTLDSGVEAIAYEKCNPESVVFGMGGVG